MMKGLFHKISKFVAAICVIAMAAAILPVGLSDAQAATDTVERTWALNYNADPISVTDEMKYDTGSVLYQGSYPEFIAGDADKSLEKKVKKLNKAVARAFHDEVMFDATEYYLASGFDTNLNVICVTSDITRLGNLFSLSQVVYLTPDGSETTRYYIKSLNFNLETGKRVTSLGKLFKKPGAFREDIYRSYKAQYKKLQDAGISSEELPAFIDWKTFKSGFDIDCLCFTAGGVIIYSPEPFLIPLDLVKDYIKEERMSLIAPASYFTYSIPCDTEDGFWILDDLGDDSCVESFTDIYLPDSYYDSNVTTYSHVFQFRGVKPGTETLHFVKLSGEDYSETTESIDVNITVSEDLRVEK